MKYEGDLKDLELFTKVIEINKFCFIYLNKKPIQLGNTAWFKSEVSAKSAIKSHLYANLCQGHYWHKGKNNTFSKEKGWERNNGSVIKTAKEFKIMAKQMTDYLLKEQIFEIKQVNLT